MDWKWTIRPMPSRQAWALSLALGLIAFVVILLLG
jgi:hypothetical protein